MSEQFFYGECPACEFSVVTKGIPPKLASNCGLCAEDSGRDVWMTFRPATDEDKAEGYDARKTAERITEAASSGLITEQNKATSANAGEK